MKTDQEIFNIVYLGLAGQGFQKSVDEDNDRCKYRGPNGLKCAAGHLIPDNAYSSLWDYKGLTAFNIPYFQTVYPNNISFILYLQSLHDFATSPQNMREEFENFAERRRLTIPEIK